MGTRALAFSRANPDSNPGYETAVARLEELIGRAAMLSDQQRNGKVDVRFASRRKRALRRAITQGHIAHLVGVAQVAEQAVPGLTDRFRLSLLGTTYMEFRAAAGGMLAEAVARKDTLMKHGLSVTVLDGLTAALEEFDTAAQRGVDGRRAHTGATQDMAAAADQVVLIVRVMDGLNRVRFSNDSQLLPAWERASAVYSDPNPATDDDPAAEPAETQGDIPPAGTAERPVA